MTLLGIVATSAWQSETVVAMRPGDNASVGRYEVTFEGSAPHQGANYNEDVARFTIRLGGAPVAEIEAAKRFYPARQMPTTEAGIKTFSFGQVYVSLGDSGSDGSLAVRFYDKPLVTLIWLGCIVMAFGGALSLSDRRLRVGAPRPARRSTTLQPAE
jgi:cytochrome c-type biogenesis protein CcmF